MSEESERYIFVDGKADTNVLDALNALIGQARERLRENVFIQFTGLSGLSDVEADHYLVRRCAEQMTAKLALSRAKGRSGWHTQDCSDDTLREMLREHLEKGDMVDVLNLAGMILVRQEVREQQASPLEHQVCLGPTGGASTKVEKIGGMLESYNWTTHVAGIHVHVNLPDEASED